MAQLPSEKDTPETLRAKMGNASNQTSVPIPVTTNKFGKKEAANDSNPFGYDEKDEEHYWYVKNIHSFFRCETAHLSNMFI